MAQWMAVWILYLMCVVCFCSGGIVWSVRVRVCVCVQFIVNALTSNVHFSVRSVILEEVILLSGPVTHTVYKQIIRLKICTLISYFTR